MPLPVLSRLHCSFACLWLRLPRACVVHNTADGSRPCPMLYIVHLYRTTEQQRRQWKGIQTNTHAHTNGKSTRQVQHRWHPRRREAEEKAKPGVEASLTPCAGLREFDLFVSWKQRRKKRRHSACGCGPMYDFRLFVCPSPCHVPTSLHLVALCGGGATRYRLRRLSSVHACRHFRRRGSGGELFSRLDAPFLSLPRALR